MDRTTERTVEALDNIAIELMRLRVLKEHELGVQLEQDAHGPYVPAPFADDEEE